MKIKSTFMAPILAMTVILLFAASRYVNLDALAYRDNICLAVIVLQLLIMTVPCGFYTRLKGTGFAGRLKFRFMGIEKILVTLLAAITLILGDTLLKLLFYNIGFIDGEYSVYYYYLNGSDPGVLYSLVTFALVPSICEELLFRSVIFAEYEGSGVITAAVASSALYAMFGMNLGYFPIYFFAGLMFSLVLCLTRSVFASMICHFCYCVFELVAGETVRTIITKPQSMGFLVFAVTAMFLLCLTALFGECERIFYGYAVSGDKKDTDKPKSHTGLHAFAEALLAPPFLISAVVFIIAALHFGGK